MTPWSNIIIESSLNINVFFSFFFSFFHHFYISHVYLLCVSQYFCPIRLYSYYKYDNVLVALQLFTQTFINKTHMHINRIVHVWILIQFSFTIIKRIYFITHILSLSLTDNVNIHFLKYSNEQLHSVFQRLYIHFCYSYGKCVFQF